MAEFVRHNVDGNGKTVKYFPVAIAKDHLLTVPEGVLVFPAIMHGAGEDQPFIIERVPLVFFPEEIVSDA